MVLLFSRFYSRIISKSNCFWPGYKVFRLLYSGYCQTSHPVDSNRFIFSFELLRNFDGVKIKVVHGCKLSNVAIIYAPIFKNTPHPYKF